MKMKNNEKKLVILFALALLVLLFGCKSNIEYHTCTYSTTWSNDKFCHWHEATCEHTGMKSDYEEHTFGGWSTIKEATFTDEGLEQRQCIICNYLEEKKVQRLKKTTYDPDDGHKIVINYYDGGSKEETHYSTDNKIDCVIYYGSTGKPYKYEKYNEGCWSFYHKAQEGNYIYKVHTNNDGTVDYIEEYDNSNNKLVYIAYYNSKNHPVFTDKAKSGNYISVIKKSDGSVDYVEEYNNSTDKLVKYKKYKNYKWADFEYRGEDGKYISVFNNSDGSVYYVEEYDNSTEKLVKITYYNFLGSVSYIVQATDGNYISVKKRSDGSVYYVEEYDNSTGKLVKFTYYNRDGDVSYTFQATDGNYFSINKDSYGNENYEEYESSTGKLVRTTKFYQKSIGKVDYIKEYDSSGKEIVNITYYKRDESGSLEYYQAAEGNYISVTHNQDGAVKCIEEFNSTTRKLVKYMIYNSKGTVSLQYQTEDGKYISVINNSDGSVDYIDEYDISTGKVVKRIGFSLDGTVYYVDEYDTSTGKVVKRIVYQSDGTVNYIDEYDTSTGKVVKQISYYFGSVVYYTIYEYATSTGKIVKKTVYNPDDSVSDYYDYTYYSSGYTIYRYRSNRTIYMVIEYVLSSDGSDCDLKTITEYNPDGTIERVTNC